MENAPENSRDLNVRSAGKQKIENLQALRGVAILLVILLHISIYEERIFKGAAMLLTFASVGQAGVDLFFVISGFVMVMVTRGRFQQPGATGNFLLRRIARIYPLYWVFTLLYLPVYFFRPEMMTRPEGTAAIHLLPSFLLLPQRFPPLVGQGWTLILEMYFYLGFALLLFFPERKKAACLQFWAIFVALGSLALVWFPALQTPVSKTVFSLRTLEFLSGCGLAILLPRGLRARGGAAVGFALAVLVLAASLLEWPPRLGQPGGLTWLRIFVFDLAAILLIAGAVGLELHQEQRCPKWLCTIGEASYSIYLSHILVLSLVFRAWTALGFTGTRAGSDALFVFAGFLTLVLAGAVIHRFVEKPLLKYGHRLVAASTARSAARTSPEVSPHFAQSGSPAPDLPGEFLQ